MSAFLDNITQDIIEGKRIDRETAVRIWQENDAFALLPYANRIKSFYKGGHVKLCSIVNAKSGNCLEDCVFCSQSSHHNSRIDTYALKSAGEILAAARNAKEAGAHEFSIVISGRGVEGEAELNEICAAIQAISKELDIIKCASLGMLTPQQFSKLKGAGLEFFHHNMETSRAFFGKICTTHTFEDKLLNIKNAKDAGLKICSGGIFGLGEDYTDRIDMAFTLRDIEVDSIPLNFLHPIEGTPASKFMPLSAFEILKTAALYRFIFADKDIRVCGGREHNLRSLQPLLFIAGINGMLVGGYLTTKGQPVEADFRMLQDLGLRYD